MALTVTSLNGAVAQGATKIVLTAFTNPSTGAIGPVTLALVDGETVQVTDASLSPTVEVARGMNGTLAVAHNTLAPVIYGLSSDFTNLAVQGSTSIQVAPEATYSVNGAISIPLVDQLIYLTKAGVAAMTLASPAADQKNTVTIMSLTANAHTITYTPGFYGGTTASDVGTFAATVGASMTIKAQNGLWNVIALAGVTIA